MIASPEALTNDNEFLFTSSYKYTTTPIVSLSYQGGKLSLLYLIVSTLMSLIGRQLINKRHYKHAMARINVHEQTALNHRLH